MAAPVERPRGRHFVRRPRFAGDIQLREVSFRYPGEEVNALTRVSLSIRAGDRVGIIGRVGSGKSTLAKLLVGLYAPTEGSVLIDGIEIRQIDPADLRRNMGYLPQNLVLFAGSVRDNLTLGAPLAERYGSTEVSTNTPCAMASREEAPVAAVHASANRVPHGSFAVTPGSSGRSSASLATSAGMTPSSSGSAMTAG